MRVKLVPRFARNDRQKGKGESKSNTGVSPLRITKTGT